MGSLKQEPSTCIENISFLVFTEEEVEKLSAVEVKKEESINALNHYVDHGIYDLHMGPMSSRDDLCKTCGESHFNCSGHCGHINLPLPVCNPFFYDVIKEMVERICPSCFRFQVSEKKAIQFCYELKFLYAGYDEMALDVGSIVKQILLDPNEALESYVDADEIENNGEVGLKEIAVLTSSLHKIFENTTKTKEPSKSPSCNSQSTYTNLRKKFIASTKKGKLERCFFCKRRLIKVKPVYSKLRIVNPVTIRTEDEEALLDQLVSESQPYLTPEQARTMFRNCFAQDGEILKNLYQVLANVSIDKSKYSDARPTDIFFIQKLLVIPPRFRPTKKINDRTLEDELSVLYKHILRQTQCIKYMIKMRKNGSAMEVPDTLADLIENFGASPDEKIFNMWSLLQASIDNILDSGLNPVQRVASRGIRQVFEKKFGVIRRHLMGKRSDQCGRSVAAPDPWLAVDQVGVPIDFALKLTYPVPVTPWNVCHLRKLVQNGPKNYPGAVSVEDEQGRKTALKDDDYKQRNAIAQSLLTPLESGVKKVNETKIVYRHLQNGDHVLINRQPTLHKLSIQAHKARIMRKDKVIRLPYSSCKAYNADFDGDELNLHFPQNELSRSESKYIVTSTNQYLTPKDGTPLSGLIQDCIVASVKMSMRGKFFNMEDYQQLAFVALSHLRGKIRLLPPAILKPKKLWSGKQVFSTLMLNLIPDKRPRPTFSFKTTVKDDMWQTQPKRPWRFGSPPEDSKPFMTESEFIMRQGELVSGIVDKCAIGSVSFGWVHVCYDLYGGDIASKVLTSINRLCVFYLQWAGHTISLKEFVTPKDAAKKRRDDLKELIRITKREVGQKLRVPEDELEEHVERVHKSENEKEMAMIDGSYTSTLGTTTSTVIKENEDSLYRSNLQNSMRMMIDTGAKGSRVNMNQMASLFGSVALDGKRMPISVTGKSLPSFKPYECDPRSGGYIPTRFVTGMDPRSYYFLCIVGRDSLQHTAVKTANSGYMQRCLIKHLEGISVKYDNTVRNSDGVVLQFEYGEDGLDVTKIPFLQSVDTIETILEAPETNCLEVVPEVEKHKKLVKKYKTECSEKKTVTGFLKFCEKMSESSEVRELLRNPSERVNLIRSFRDLGADELEKLRTSFAPKFSAKTGRALEAEVLIGLWRKKSEEEKAKLLKFEKLKKKSIPVPSKFFGSSTCQFGVVSEALDDLIDQYYDTKYSQRRIQEQTLTRDEVKKSLYIRALKSKVDPGEAVGALCAQAIGEPLTQMTLNTFHFAGRDELNVTLGVPRMIEILRTASEKIKTPIMEVPFKEGVSKSATEKLKKMLTPVPLQMVLSGVTVSTSLEKVPEIRERCIIRFSILPYSVYKRVFCTKPQEVIHWMERFYFKKVLIKWIDTANRQLSSYGSTVRVSSKDDEESPTPELEIRRGIEEEEDSDDEDQDQGMDLGASDANKQGTTKERDFEEDQEEEEEEVQEDSDEEDSTDKVKIKVEKEIDADDLFEPEDEMEPIVEDVEDATGYEEKYDPKKKIKKEPIDKQNNSKKKKTTSSLPSSVYLSRKNNVISQEPWIKNYDYDQENSLWCEITLDLPVSEGRYDLASILRNTAQQSFVHNMKNIKKAFVVEGDDGRFMLRTEGVNMMDLLLDRNALAVLDFKSIYTNNIHVMAKTFGIEAAQRSVIKELREVQKAYDIKVDFRHLTLLSDYFTCEGVYKACSRFALDTCASPIQKMSFETCFTFMKRSLLQGLQDKMSSPSASVIVGQPVKVGTNCMELLQKVS